MGALTRSELDDGMAGLGKGYERRLESEMNQNVCLPKKACLNKGLQTYSVNPFFYSPLYFLVFSFFLVVCSINHIKIHR